MNKKNGFTLIELIVVFGIFSVVMIVLVNIFINAVQMQNYALASERVVDQTSYVMEYMSRALRMAETDTTGACTGNTSSKETYSINSDTSGDIGVTFLDQTGQCTMFCFSKSSKALYQKTNAPDTSACNINSSPLTSMQVNSFNFSSNEQGDSVDETQIQPKITMALDMQATGITPAPEIKIQTTVSQRDPSRFAQ